MSTSITNDIDNISIPPAKKAKPSVEQEQSPTESTDAEQSQREQVEEKVKAEIKEEDEDDEHLNASVISFHRKSANPASRNCPYLGSINRAVLDFDFEKLCSVSLSHINVYACLVCGKYFQGRGPNTHAYTHALECDHHVFLNLLTFKFYCLPEDYEIIDSALEDIKFVCRPSFTVSQVAELNECVRVVRAADDSTYRQGLMGLNNIKANDYCNVVLHALSNVPPLRDFFLRDENYTVIKRPPGDKLVLLTQRYGELLRKLWNPRAFKSHVSPHEILQAVVLCSNKKFQFIKQGDSVEFLGWLLNTLHQALNGTGKSSSSVIYKTFRGRMRSYTRKMLPVDVDDEMTKLRLLENKEYQEREESVPFVYLTLDLPPSPLYRDEHLQNIIPQVPLNVLLQKFNGTTEKEYKTYKDNFMKRFVLTRLPQFLIICYKRFIKNSWYTEKNPTIVNFAIKNVDFYDILAEDARPSHSYTTYDLISNVVHDGKPENGTYRIQLLHRGTGKWFELEDLHVTEILPQMITLTESYIQVWELNRSKTREERAGEVHAENL